MPLPPHRHVTGERRPIEILVFVVDPADVDEFLRVDHEVWTLGEAGELDGDVVPFLSKEVWLNDNRPGEITLVFVWPDQATWDAVGETERQDPLIAAFDQRFERPYELSREIHLEEDHGIHRFSRFERAG
ncbi:MAG: TIGR03792 family protein [Actinomycetota bacterium]